MQAPWNPPTPIEALFTQLNVGIRFATAGKDAPSETSVFRIGYNNINATGLFDVACREWRGKDDATKTLATFHRHFRDADQDRRHNQTTAGTAGYHGANAAAEQRPTKKPNPATTTNPTTIAARPDLRPNTSYCWSHGFLKSPIHTSHTCKFKKEGHQDAATGTNQLGGATGTFTPCDQATA